MPQQPLGPMMNINIGQPKIGNVNAQTKSSIYELTPIGKSKVKDYEGGEGKRWEVLSELGVRGPSSKRELDEVLGIGPEKLQKVLDDLTKEQLVIRKQGG